MNWQVPQSYEVTLSNGITIVCPYIRWPAADFYHDCVKPHEETA